MVVLDEVEGTRVLAHLKPGGCKAIPGFEELVLRYDGDGISFSADVYGMRVSGTFTR